VLAETVAEAARRFGERPAIVGGDTLTFADLDRLSGEVAVGLQRAGVGPGDVVATVLPAVPGHFVVYAAAARIGAITAAVNPRLTAPERRAVLETADPAVTVNEPGEVDELRVVGAAPPVLPPDPDRPVALVFTSGTTGVPKGAVFSGRQLAFITETDVGPAWGGGGDALAGPALAHLGPMTKLPGALRRGTTQHLVRTWRAGEVLRRMAELRVTSMGGVPTQLALMLRDPTFDRIDLSSVRAVVIGGGPATPALIREARERIGAPLAVRYSCTEAGIGTGTALDGTPEDAEISVGRPQPGVTLRIVDPDGGEVARGEVGEVVLSSPAVMSGYWRGPAAPAEGVRTGDLGWVDDRGRLHLAGRARELYVRGGFNVHPMEVEAVLADHPAVAAVAVIGREDPVMGEVGVAVVVPRGRPPSVEELRAFAESRLARYKLPDQVVYREALPLTAMDKIDRKALRQFL
jgi:acyl-CoA synthetase (AMP-forming)/AMP-acid ligase II